MSPLIFFIIVFCASLLTFYVNLPTIQNAPSSSSSPSSKPQPEYEVFLSFGGGDTRNTFTDHLYHALVKKGIITFKDDKDLAMGDPISAEILEAIEKSRKAVIILSKNYASSTRCLEELAKIVECMKGGLKVLPIFYRLIPDDVLYQSGTFEVAFAEHEKRFEENTVQKWRDALTEVANICGEHINGQKEAEWIQSFVDEIYSDSSLIVYGSIKKSLIVYEDGQIGIGSLVEEMMFALLGYAAGVGPKTTILFFFNLLSVDVSSCIYNLIGRSCFLSGGQGDSFIFLVAKICTSYSGFFLRNTWFRAFKTTTTPF